MNVTPNMSVRGRAANRFGTAPIGTATHPGGMETREDALRALAADVRDHDAVRDVWLARSFTDRLVVVELAADEPFPAALRERFADHGLRGANDVYGTDADDPSRVGSVDGAPRHRFVDVETRDEHRSNVIT